jgi:hypothetical protein
MHIHRSKTRFCVFYTVVPEATSRPLLGIVNKGGFVDLDQQCQSSRATRMHAQINKPTGVHVSAVSVCAVPIPVLGVNVIPGVGWETKANHWRPDLAPLRMGREQWGTGSAQSSGAVR